MGQLQRSFQWTMDNGQLTIDNGSVATLFPMDNGQLTIDNGSVATLFPMDNGQWTIDNGSVATPSLVSLVSLVPLSPLSPHPRIPPSATTTNFQLIRMAPKNRDVCIRDRAVVPVELGGVLQLWLPFALHPRGDRKTRASNSRSPHR